MLPDEASHIRAIRSGLAAETWRVGRVLQRQIAAIENLFAMKVRERHFGRRNQEQIPVAADAEEILLELWKVPRSCERRAVHQKRRLDFLVAVVACVDVEHEIDQRPLEPGAGAQQHGKARA
jgi:hypothetical protein